MVADKPALVSGNVPSAQLYAGDFAHTWLLMWGRGVQIEINPNAGFRAGVVGMRVVCCAAVAVTHPSAYHASTGVT